MKYVLIAFLALSTLALSQGTSVPWTTGCNPQFGVLGTDGRCHAAITVDSVQYRSLQCTALTPQKPGSNTLQTKCQYLPK
jgi:hypothetical protein